MTRSLGSGVGLVPDPARERERAGERELHRSIGVREGEHEVVDQSERRAFGLGSAAGRQRRRSSRSRRPSPGAGSRRRACAPAGSRRRCRAAARRPRRRRRPAISWSLIAALIATSWISLQVGAADAPLVVVGLQPLQPLGHGVGADDRRRERGTLRSRRVVVCGGGFGAGMSRVGLARSSSSDVGARRGARKGSKLDLEALAACRWRQERAVDPVDDRAVVLARAAEAAFVRSASVTKRSWHSSRRRGAAAAACP